MYIRKSALEMYNLLNFSERGSGSKDELQKWIDFRNKHKSQTMSQKSAGMFFGPTSFDSLPSKVQHRVFAHENEAICLAFNCTGALIATGGGDCLIKVWDIERNMDSQ